LPQLKTLGIVGISAVVGAALYGAFQGRFHTTGQPPGDPPVTVSDGSLHAHSLNKWLGDKTPTSGTGLIITPNPSGATLSANCSAVQVNSQKVAAYLWTDDEKVYDLTPGSNATLTITIVHDPNDGDSDANVIISYPPSGPLTITTDQGTFDGQTLKNRLHSRRGNVASITVTGTATAFNPPNSSGAPTWTPPNPANPHFTLGFCYK